MNRNLLLRRTAAMLVVLLMIPIMTIMSVSGAGTLVALVHDTEIGGLNASHSARVDLDASNAPNQTMPAGSKIRARYGDNDVTAEMPLVLRDGYSGLRWGATLEFPVNMTQDSKVYMIQYHLGDGMWQDAAGFINSVTVKSSNPPTPGAQIDSVSLLDSRIGSLGGKCRVRIAGSNLYGQVKVKAVYPKGQTSEYLLTADALDETGNFKIQFPINTSATGSQNFTIWCATGYNGVWKDWVEYSSASGVYDYNDFYPTQAVLDYQGGAVPIYMGGNLPNLFGGSLRVKGISASGRETLPVSVNGTGTDGVAVLTFPPNTTDSDMVWTLYYSTDNVSWNPNPHTGKTLSGQPYTVTVQGALTTTTFQDDGEDEHLTTTETALTEKTPTQTQATTAKTAAVTTVVTAKTTAPVTAAPNTEKTVYSTGKEPEADLEDLGSGPSGSDFDTMPDETSETTGVTTAEVEKKPLPEQELNLNTVLIVVGALAAGAAAVVYIILFLKRKK